MRAPDPMNPGRGAIPLAALLLALAVAPAPAQVPAQEPPQVAAQEPVQEPVQETAQDPAQEPVQGPSHIPNRGGHFFMDAGAGYGYMRLTCLTCASVVRVDGVAFTATVGGSPSRKVLLGLQAQLWQSTGTSVKQTVKSLLAIAQWYPWLGMGFFLRAGTGIVQGPVAPLVVGPSLITAQGTGVSLAIGAGYDLRVTRHLGLTVQASTQVAALGDLTIAAQTAKGVIAYVSRIGLAVVFR